MTSEVKEWGDEATPDAGPPASHVVAEPTLFFGSVDKFVREQLRYTYSRRVVPQDPSRWSTQWWKYPDAISRLDALWQSWGELRLAADVWDERVVA